MTDNITIVAGGNTTTIFPIKIEETLTKNITPIAYPTTQQSWSNGPTKPKILDLLRIIRRFTINGYIKDSEVTQFKGIIEAGGVFTMNYAGSSYTVNMEKCSVTEVPEDATGTGGPSGTKDPEHLAVLFTLVEGENL